MTPRKTSEPVEARPADRPDHDAAALAVRLEELTAALPARKSIVGDRLKDRLDLLLIAGGAYAVRGLIVGVAGLQFVDKRTEFRPYKRIAVRLGLKAVDATLFLVEAQKRALHRYLLRLKPDQTIQQVRDQLLRRGGIDIGLIEQTLEVMRKLRRALGEAHEASARGKDGRDGL